MITTSMTIIGVTGTQYQGCVKTRLKLPTTTMGTMTMITGAQYQAYHLVQQRLHFQSTQYQVIHVCMQNAKQHFE